MKVEQFHAELFERVLVDDGWDGNINGELLASMMRNLNIMTGGAFFRSIGNLKDDYVFPSGEGET